MGENFPKLPKPPLRSRHWNDEPHQFGFTYDPELPGLELAPGHELVKEKDERGRDIWWIRKMVKEAIDREGDF